MDKCGTEYQPIILLQVLHMAFPRFAEKNEHGVYVQQVLKTSLYKAAIKILVKINAA